MAIVDGFYLTTPSLNVSHRQCVSGEHTVQQLLGLQHFFVFFSWLATATGDNTITLLLLVRVALCSGHGGVGSGGGSGGSS